MAQDCQRYLYAANFHAGTVDVFDNTFAPHSFGGSAFVDPNIPTGFAPFNVQLIGSDLPRSTMTSLTQAMAIWTSTIRKAI
jgi:hypothetical protein